MPVTVASDPAAPGHAARAQYGGYFGAFEAANVPLSGTLRGQHGCKLIRVAPLGAARPIGSASRPIAVVRLCDQ